MAIKSKYKRKKKKIEIDLTGPDGNAFVLLGYAKRLSRELDLNYKQILDEMMEGNYENLINVFDKYFGDFVDLYR
tara:strand:+ start:112 stop:336 length:225 start_codon:yes stop_codon:yes gene_type:complete